MPATSIAESRPSAKGGLARKCTRIPGPRCGTTGITAALSYLPSDPGESNAAQTAGAWRSPETGPFRAPRTARRGRPGYRVPRPRHEPGGRAGRRQGAAVHRRRQRPRAAGPRARRHSPGPAVRHGRRHRGVGGGRPALRRQRVHRRPVAPGARGRPGAAARGRPAAPRGGDGRRADRDPRRGGGAPRLQAGQRAARPRRPPRRRLRHRPAHRRGHDHERADRNPVLRGARAAGRHAADQRRRHLRVGLDHDLRRHRPAGVRRRQRARRHAPDHVRGAGREQPAAVPADHRPGVPGQRSGGAAERPRSLAPPRRPDSAASRGRPRIPSRLCASRLCASRLCASRVGASRVGANRSGAVYRAAVPAFRAYVRRPPADRALRARPGARTVPARTDPGRQRRRGGGPRRGRRPAAHPGIALPSPGRSGEQLAGRAHEQRGDHGRAVDAGRADGHAVNRGHDPGGVRGHLAGHGDHVRHRGSGSLADEHHPVHVQARRADRTRDSTRTASTPSP